jgi:BMFP domain-containing protein YqiC
MKKCNKVYQTCNELKPAMCVEYEGITNNLSEIKEDCTKTIENTTEDIYNQLEELNLTLLGERCLDYVETAEGKLIVKNVLLKYEEEICNLKTRVLALEDTDICDKDITGCSLIFGTLTNQCNTQPQTLKEVIQLILTNLNTP